MADYSYLEKLQKERITKGSKLPHPQEWKGDKLKYASQKAEQKTPSLLEFVDEKDFNKRYETSDGKRRHLTPKQILKAKYILQGYTKRQAGLRAGYSEATVNKNPMSSQPILVSFLEGLQGKFAKEGITETFVAKKLSEWMDAKRIVRIGTEEIAQDPDYKTQLEAFKQWQNIVLPKSGGSSGQGKRREMTITEWVNESDSTAAE